MCSIRAAVVSARSFDSAVRFCSLRSSHRRGAGVTEQQACDFVDMAQGVCFSPPATSMVILMIWFGASLLLGVVWAAAGLLLGDASTDDPSAEEHEGKSEPMDDERDAVAPSWRAPARLRRTSEPARMR